MLNKLTAFQKYLYFWSIFVTIISLLIIIITTIISDKPDKILDTLFEILFIHTVLIIGIRWYYFVVVTTNDEKYVKEKYPDIWNKTYSSKGIKQTGRFFSKFVKNQYDDCSDARLNLIKYHHKIDVRINYYIFFLPVFMFIFYIILSTIFH